MNENNAISEGKATSWNVLAFGFRKVRWILLFSFLLGFAILLFVFSGDMPRTDWWDIVEPIVQSATLVAAITIWFGEVKQDWEASLRKYLSVDFKFGNSVIMRCEKARLTNISDIRAWAQQLGGQMCNNEPIRFSPNFETKKYLEWEDSSESGKGIWTVHYRAEFKLRELPQYIRKLNLADKSPVVHWEPPDFRDHVVEEKLKTAPVP